MMQGILLMRGGMELQSQANEQLMVRGPKEERCTGEDSEED